MSQTLEQPGALVDAPLILQESNEPDRAMVRYLFFAGDVVSAHRRRELVHLRDGGEEIPGARGSQNACMVRTQGFLRKGRITPLEIGPEIMTQEDKPEGVDAFFFVRNNAATIAPTVLSNLSPGLIALRKYPGDALTTILTSSINITDGAIPKGIIEIKALRNHTYNTVQVDDGHLFDKDIWEIQRYIFPDYPRVPLKLSEFEALIRIAHMETHDDTLRSVCEDMLVSCDQFRFWAMTQVEKDEVKLRGGAKGDFVPSYSPLSEILLPQLDKPRQDQGMQTMADVQQAMAKTLMNVAGQPSSQVDVRSIIEMFQGQQDKQNEFMQGIVEQFGEILKAQNKTPAAPRRASNYVGAAERIAAEIEAEKNSPKEDESGE